MKTFFSTIKPNMNVLIPIVLFGLIFSLISIGNHYNFRTYARDLGIFTNALYDYAHFQWNKPTVLHLELNNILGDHFLVLAFFIAPFTYFFGSYTLPIFQIFSILLGGLGVYKIVNQYSGKRFATISIIHFFSIWGIYSALAFDAHYSIIGSMMVPWLIYYLLNKNIGKSALLFFIILLTKENFSIWLFFIALAFSIVNFRDRKQLIFLSSVMFFCVGYFFVMMSYVMPALSGPNNTYIHFDYTILGNNFSEVIKTVITKPIYTIKMFFGNFLGKSSLNYLKTETIVAFLLSGGFLLYRKPMYLLMLLPIFGQKFFNNYFSKWGLFNHYSIELVPLIVIGFYLALKDFKFSNSIKNKLAISVAIISFSISIFMVRNSHSVQYRKENYEFYRKHHYKRVFNSTIVHKEINKLPKDAIISAQSPVVPHLALRDIIYEYPNILDAEYIVLLPKEETTYPLKKPDYDKKMEELKNSNSWDKYYEDNNVIILKRKNNESL